jgi:hypothetical protein
VDVVDSEAKVRISIEHEADKYWKNYVIGEDETDRRYGIDDQPTDQVHPENEQ